jgi:CHAD domain-containing protein
MMSTPATPAKDSAVQGLLNLLTSLEPARMSLTAEDVHRLRVAIKQARAWLKLCRAVTGTSTAYHLLVENLRALSAGLAGQRDREVVLQTLAGLARKYPGKKAQQLIEELRRQLAHHQAPTGTAASLAMVVTQTRQGLQEFTQQPIPPAIQLAVIKRTFAKMCKSGARALDSQSCPQLHAWRKQVKTLGYQLAMLSVATAPLKKSIARLNKLGSKLGDIHDLCMLTAMVEEMQEQRQAELNLTPLCNRVSREHTALMASVRKRYHQLCAPLPVLTPDQEEGVAV